MLSCCYWLENKNDVLIKLTNRMGGRHLRPFWKCRVPFVITSNIFVSYWIWRHFPRLLRLFFALISILIAFLFFLFSLSFDVHPAYYTTRWNVCSSIPSSTYSCLLCPLLLARPSPSQQGVHTYPLLLTTWISASVPAAGFLFVVNNVVFTAMHIKYSEFLRSSRRNFRYYIF